MDKLKHIRIGDEVTFQRNGKIKAGVVDGWIDREVAGRYQKCVEIANTRLWVPVGVILSRRRNGAGVMVFEIETLTPPLRESA